MISSSDVQIGHQVTRIIPETEVNHERIKRTKRLAYFSFVIPISSQTSPGPLDPYIPFPRYVHTKLLHIIKSSNATETIRGDHVHQYTQYSSGQACGIGPRKNKPGTAQVGAISKAQKDSKTKTTFSTTGDNKSSQKTKN